MAVPALATLPAILAGPILRRVERGSVSVWVALQREATLKLTVKLASDGSARLSKSVPAVQTVKIGTNLFVALVTASASGPGDELQPGQLHAYDLATTTTSETFASVKTPGHYVRSSETFSNTLLAYEGMSGVHASVAGLPTFVLPATTPAALRIAHGSCRKPHADSLDALATVDKILGETATTLATRPQQLLMTGDQIYADDVGDALLALIQEAAPLLIATEDLPNVTPAELRTGKRASLVVNKLGFSGGKSHLLSFREFAAMYLFVWSDLLWPSSADQIPKFEQVYPDVPSHTSDGRQEYETALFTNFQRERDALVHFHKDLRRVRRALANVACYMVADDHEVTDDFYLNRAWLKGSLLNDQKPLSRRVVLDGLLAFMAFQASGNVPGRYDGLLAQLAAWAAANFPGIGPMVDQLESAIGLPTKGSQVETDREFQRAPGAPVWHFHITWDCHEIFGLDARTHRVYPAGDLTPAGMLSDFSIQNQVPAAAPAWRDQSIGGVSLIVMPAPIVGLSFIEGKQLEATANKQLTFDRDVEAPRLDGPSFDALLFRLAARDQRRSRAVFLCGDVHYGFAGLLEYWSPKAMEDLPNPPSADTRAAFAQVVASALKNQHPVAAFAGTLALHFAGFRGSRRQITRFGWQSSLAAGKSLTVGEVEWRDLAQSAPPVRTADWQVTVDRDGLARTDLEIELRRYLSVTPGTPAPDFRNRLTLVDPGARSVTVEPVNDEPVSLIDLLLALIKVFFHWMFRYTFIARGGRQIVGVNNVAILAFRWGAGEDKAVIQELHWWAKNFRTLYEAHDAADDAQYLTTTRCEVALAIREPPANEKIEF